MKKTSVLAFLAIIIAVATVFPLHAQYMEDQYDKETIHLSVLKYTKNGESYPIGLFGKKLRSEMAVSPDAAIEFKSYEDNQKKALVFSAIGLGAIIGGFNLNDSHAAEKVALFMGGAGMVVVSLPLSVKSKKSLHKAIWLRNREVLK